MLFLLLLAAEICLRLPVVVDGLPRPEPSLWHSPLIQAKLDYLREFEKRSGVDLLFIGNSAVQAGFSPEVFDTESGTHSLRQGGSFNAAIEGLPPFGVRLFLEIYLRYTTPQVIVYGLTPQDINSNSPWAKDVTARVKNSTLALAESRRGLRGHACALLLKGSALYRYRYVLHQLLMRAGRHAESAVYFDERGFHPISRSLADLPPKDRVRLRNRAGFLNYGTDGVQLKELEEVIALCARHNIKLILANMPLADGYYANFDRPTDYARYLNALKEVAARHNLLFWDLEHLGTGEDLADADFADLNHLNRSGAFKLSKMTAGRWAVENARAEYANR